MDVDPGFFKDRLTPGTGGMLARVVGPQWSTQDPTEICLIFFAPASFGPWGKIPPEPVWVGGWVGGGSGGRVGGWVAGGPPRNFTSSLPGSRRRGAPRGPGLSHRDGGLRQRPPAPGPQVFDCRRRRSFSDRSPTSVQSSCVCLVIIVIFLIFIMLFNIYNISRNKFSCCF